MTVAPPRPRATGASRPPGPRRPGAPTSARGTRNRYKIGRLVLVVLLGITMLKLVSIQTIQAGTLSAESANQLSTTIALPAERGSILDRSGAPLAFSVAASALITNPMLIAKTKGDATAAYVAAMAEAVGKATGQDVTKLRDQLGDAGNGYLVLAKLVDPDVARKLTTAFPEIAEERREDRQYPNGTLAANVIGTATWDQAAGKLVGKVGLESSQDNLLGGSDGRREVDTVNGSNTIIPGSTRFERPAIPGSTVQLTLDSDLQYMTQKALNDAVTKTGAKKDSSVVVLDAKTSEVLALATGDTFDPKNLGDATASQLDDPAVTAPFEPGSVNKIVTMAAALQSGVAKPDDVLDVPGSIKVADRTINDAWVHGLDHYTLTGVLAKSSNVGTIMTAQKVGVDRFVEMLTKMGIGTATDVGLPGESAGDVPPVATWSGSTFGNLPIGQGLTMTVLQMAGMYQAVANNGVRIPPRIIESVTGPDGVRTAPPAPKPVEVVSPDTAAKLRTMLTAITQKGTTPNGISQNGTGFPAAVPGYQVAGKTGTAQQVDPRCGCYSANVYWITFAGMIPAQDPRYVIGIMLDAPTGGASAAPLFHDIATYLAQREHLPVSPDPAPLQTLQEP
ncbi:peptidoglycan D,D-transpeptidase FtsI family protein [Pseudonocardia sp. GCM10023141]|uniref:peptidoglycan D,D-transpeptidase FtsI family protein n=1 Tax=Pseudonocardia sp. GCM10023141 TaxID=3252653 RepID=UPI0036201F12